MIRLLLDEGIPRRAVTRLRERGFAARHVADIGLERASDLDILQAARGEGECVVTMEAARKGASAHQAAGSQAVHRVGRGEMGAHPVHERGQPRVLSLIRHRLLDVLRLSALTMGRPLRRVAPAGDDDDVRRTEHLEPVRDGYGKPDGGRQRPGFGRADPEVEARHTGVHVAEHHAGHGEVKRADTVEGDDRNRRPGHRGVPQWVGGLGLHLIALHAVSTRVRLVELRAVL